MPTYQPTAKHKPGAVGGGPPRWFPSSASVCPPDLSVADAQRLLDGAVEGRDAAHPDSKARYAVDDEGRFFKAYSEDGGQHWHGYPVAADKVPTQVPCRVLRTLRDRGLITPARYRRLLGSAS